MIEFDHAPIMMTKNMRASIICVFVLIGFSVRSHAEQSQDRSGVLESPKSPAAVENNSAETPKRVRKKKFGFKKGDVARSPRGDAVDSTEKAMELCNKMKTQDKIRIETQRDETSEVE